MNPENPRYVTNLLKSLKPEFNVFEFTEKLSVRHLKTGVIFQLPTSKLPVLPSFSFAQENNNWRIKDRDISSKTYLIFNHELESYVNLPYVSITVFSHNQKLSDTH